MRLPRLSRTRIALVIAVVVVGYLFVAFIGDTLLSRRLSGEQQQLQREIAELQQQQERLEQIRGYLRTDEYIEGAARRVLGLVRPGETLYVVTSSVTPTPPAPGDEPVADDRPWWERLFSQ